MGIACAQQDVAHVYPLPDDPERCLEDFVAPRRRARPPAGRAPRRARSASVQRFLELNAATTTRPRAERAQARSALRELARVPLRAGPPVRCAAVLARRRRLLILAVPAIVVFLALSSAGRALSDHREPRARRDPRAAAGRGRRRRRRRCSPARPPATRRCARDACAPSRRGCARDGAVKIALPDSGTSYSLGATAPATAASCGSRGLRRAARSCSACCVRRAGSPLTGRSVSLAARHGAAGRQRGPVPDARRPSRSTASRRRPSCSPSPRCSDAACRCSSSPSSRCPRPPLAQGDRRRPEDRSTRPAPPAAT